MLSTPTEMLSLMEETLLMLASPGPQAPKHLVDVIFILPSIDLPKEEEDDESDIEEEEDEEEDTKKMNGNNNQEEDEDKDE